MSIKYKTVKPSRLKGTKFSKLLDGLKKDFFQASAQWRKSVVDEIEGKLEGTDRFWEEFNEAVFNLGNNAKGLDKIADLNPQAVGKLETFSNAIKNLNNVLGIKTTYETDHTTMAPVNQRITLTIIAIDDLVKTLNVMDSIGVGSAEQRKRIREEGLYRVGVVNKTNSETDNSALNLTNGLIRAANELRKVRALGEVIEKEYNANPGKPIGAKQLRAGLQALKDSNGNIDIQEFKEKDLGLKDGNIATFAITVAADHENKSEWQRIQGILRNNITGGKTPTITRKAQIMYDEMEEALKSDIGGITGSDSIEKVLADQATDIFKGKKPKKYKSTYKKKTSKGGAVRTPRTKRTPSTANRKLSEIYSISNLAVRRNSREANSHRRDKGDLQKELNRLRVLINRRLPAQVRQNMGRPALINQTGRFSNSVRVESLLAGSGKTIQGEYTYQLSPYETFENTGVYQWPQGYNPKPLIAKSIRQLAMEYTEQKLTLRRT